MYSRDDRKLLPCIDCGCLELSVAAPLLKEPDELVLGDPYRAAEAIGLDLARLDPAPDRAFAHLQRVGGLRDCQQSGQGRWPTATPVSHQACPWIHGRRPTPSGAHARPTDELQPARATGRGPSNDPRRQCRSAFGDQGCCECCRPCLAPKQAGPPQVRREKSDAPYRRRFGERAFLIRSATASAVFEGA